MRYKLFLYSLAFCGLASLATSVRGFQAGGACYEIADVSCSDCLAGTGTQNMGGCNTCSCTTSCPCATKVEPSNGTVPRVVDCRFPDTSGNNCQDSYTLRTLADGVTVVDHDCGHIHTCAARCPRSGTCTANGTAAVKITCSEHVLTGAGC